MGLNDDPLFDMLKIPEVIGAALTPLKEKIGEASFADQVYAIPIDAAAQALINAATAYCEDLDERGGLFELYKLVDESLRATKNIATKRRMLTHDVLDIEMRSVLRALKVWQQEKEEEWQVAMEKAHAAQALDEEEIKARKLAKFVREKQLQVRFGHKWRIQGFRSKTRVLPEEEAGKQSSGGCCVLFGCKMM